MAQKNYLFNGKSSSDLISVNGVVNQDVFGSFMNNPENKDYVSGEGNNRKIRLNKLIEDGRIAGGLFGSASTRNVHNQILSESAKTIFDLETAPIIFDCQFANMLDSFSIDDLNEFIKSKSLCFDNSEAQIKGAMSSIVFKDKSIKDAREIAEHQNGKFKFLLSEPNIGASIRSYADGSVDHISLLFDNRSVLRDLINTNTKNYRGILRSDAFDGVVLNDETLEKLGINKKLNILKFKIYVFLSCILYLFTKTGLFCSTYRKLRSTIRKNQRYNTRRDRQISDLEDFLIEFNEFNKNVESKMSVAEKIGEIKNKNNKNEFDKSINLIGVKEEK